MGLSLLNCMPFCLRCYTYKIQAVSEAQLTKQVGQDFCPVFFVRISKSFVGVFIFPLLVCVHVLYYACKSQTEAIFIYYLSFPFFVVLLYPMPLMLKVHVFAANIKACISHFSALNNSQWHSDLVLHLNKLNYILILFNQVAVLRKLIKVVLVSSSGKAQPYFSNYINQHDRNTKDLFTWCYCLPIKLVTEAKICREDILWIPLICSSTGFYI